MRVLLAMIAAGCVSTEGRDRCLTDDDCLADRFCVDGRCRNEPPDGGITACNVSEECGDNAHCDLLRQICECDDRFHDCAGFCVSDLSIESCGTSCTACPTDPNGAPICDGVACSFDCNQGSLLCGGRCAPCSTGTSSVGCDGDRCIALACEPGFHSCGDGCCEWRLETIESGAVDFERVGLNARMYVDPEGGVHVMSSDTENERIRYAHRDLGGVWTTETIADTMSGFNIYFEISVDSMGRPIAAFLTYGFGFAIARRDPTWSYTLIPELATSDEVSMVFRDDVLHFASSITTTDLHYGTYDGAFSSEPIQAVTTAFLSVELALDQTGAPHVAFTALDDLQWRLAYALRSESWSEEPVAYRESLIAGFALDAGGVPHVLYYDNDLAQLVYARKGQEGWSREVIGPDSIGPAALAIDGDVPAIAYGRDGMIKLAKRTASGWIDEVVASSTISGIDLVFDAIGDAHLVFHDETDDRLIYAR